MVRSHVEIVHSDEVAPQPFDAPGWPPGAELRLLSLDNDLGALTGLLDLPAGWRRGPGRLSADTDLLVLEGSVRIGDEVRGHGWYEWLPAGSPQERWSVDERCRLLLMPRSGPPDFEPGDFAAAAGASPAGPIGLDASLLPWRSSPIPGPPPGFVFKTLRNDPATGETCALYAAPPRRIYDAYEFHDCAEEVLLIEGDVRSPCGLMRPGSYFWRPPYITHGPFSSVRGNYCFLYVDSALVNRFAAGPLATPEQNRAQAAGEPPAANYVRDSEPA